MNKLSSRADQWCAFCICGPLISVSALDRRKCSPKNEYWLNGPPHAGPLCCCWLIEHTHRERDLWSTTPIGLVNQTALSSLPVSPPPTRAMRHSLDLLISYPHPRHLRLSRPPTDLRAANFNHFRFGCLWFSIQICAPRARAPLNKETVQNDYLTNALNDEKWTPLSGKNGRERGPFPWQTWPFIQ